MRNLFILLCLVAMAACAQRKATTQPDVVIVNHTLDSMIVCMTEAEDVLDLGDTVAETDDGMEALEAWDNMLECDTIHMSYARGVFSVLAHEMLLVIDAQLDCDPDDPHINAFNARWGAFLRYSCDMEE